MNSALGWAGLVWIILATLTIWIPGEWPHQAWRIGWFGLAGAALWVAPRAGLWDKRTLLALGSLALVATLSALQAVAGISCDRSTSWQASLGWLAAACVVFVVAGSASAEAGDELLLAAGGFAGILSAYSLAQAFLSGGRVFWFWPGAEPMVFGPFLSRNNYASFCLLFLPVLVWRSLFRRGANWPWAMGAGVMAASVIASGSRAGAALLVLELAALGGAAARRRHRVRWKPFLAVVGVLVLAVGAAGWDHLAYKLSDADPMRYRKEMALSALEMARVKPIFGYGMGTFPVAYPAFATFDIGLWVNFAHNDWLQWAAEGGLLVLAPLVLFGALGLSVARRHLWALGLPAVFLHALVDYPLQREGVFAWVLFLTTLGLATIPGGDGPFSPDFRRSREG